MNQYHNEFEEPTWMSLAWITRARIIHDNKLDNGWLIKTKQLQNRFKVEEKTTFGKTISAFSSKREKKATQKKWYAHGSLSFMQCKHD